jgi:hypothetical protein
MLGTNHLIEPYATASRLEDWRFGVDRHDGGPKVRRGLHAIDAVAQGGQFVEDEILKFSRTGSAQS